jgi:hypothetical protein
VAAVPEAADKVRVVLQVPGDAMVAGEKVAVTPLGIPVTENVIAELNRYRARVDNTTCVDLPDTRLALVELGVTVSVKVGGRTVRVSG